MLDVELAALYRLGRLVVGIESRVLALHLGRLDASPLRISVPLPPQLPLDRVELCVEILVRRGSALERVSDIRQGQRRDDRHALVRGAHQRAVAVLLALLGLAPHLSVGLEVLEHGRHVLEGLERALLEALDLARVVEERVLFPRRFTMDVPPQVAAHFVEVIRSGGDVDSRDGSEGVDELLPRVRSVRLWHGLRLVRHVLLRQLAYVLPCSCFTPVGSRVKVRVVPVLLAAGAVALLVPEQVGALALPDLQLLLDVARLVLPRRGELFLFQRQVGMMRCLPAVGGGLVLHFEEARVAQVSD